MRGLTPSLRSILARQGGLQVILQRQPAPQYEKHLGLNEHPVGHRPGDADQGWLTRPDAGPFPYRSPPGHPTAAVTIVIAVLLLVVLGLIGLIGRPPTTPAPAPPPPVGDTGALQLGSCWTRLASR
jgi:hypothetical protein